MAGMYLLAQDFSGILDALIHAWVLYYLIVGVRYGHQLRTLPEEAPEPQEQVAMSVAVINAETASLRLADTTVKARVFLEADVDGHRVCFRRVKRINELVIDGYVYDDVEMLVETAHSLSATLEGHVIQVGFDGAAHSYLRVDGQPVARKLRLW